MNCRTCNYPLWNLAGRACPECGAAFLPSQFEFVPNSVRFCCPHCATSYFGTSPTGQLVPDAFNCVHCAQPITMDACVLLPALGVTDEQTQPEVFPWFQPGKRWRIGSWFVMMGRAMGTPTRLARSLPPTAPMGLRLAVISVIVPFWISLSVLLIAPIVMISAGRGQHTLLAFGWLLLLIVGSTVAVAVAMLLWAACVHLALVITGGADGGFVQTGKALCYTAPTVLPAATPCMGSYIWPIVLPWWCISAGIALAELQRVPLWRGIFAAVAPGALLIALAIGLVVSFLVF